MSDKVIVLVRDRDDSEYGEISVFEDPARAERVLEALLEAGFQRERIQVFYGHQMDLRVTYKPAVVLASEGAPPPAGPDQPAEGNGHGDRATLPRSFHSTSS